MLRADGFFFMPLLHGIGEEQPLPEGVGAVTRAGFASWGAYFRFKGRIWPLPEVYLRFKGLMPK